MHRTTPVAVIACSIALAACASIVHGTSQDIGISSTPTSASVTIDNAAQGQTPFVAKLSRKDNHVIHIAADGYEPADLTLTRSTSGWVWGNLVFGGLIGARIDGDRPYFEFQVEKPAVARDENPAPRYPSVLESSRVEGEVLAQFVVDTTGNADMSTLEILRASNALFSASLASALPRWRFYPAEAGGRKVKQIVQIPIRFVAPPR